MVMRLLLALLSVAAMATTDYDADLQRLQRQIDAAPDDLVKVAALRYHHASLTTDYADLRAAEQAIDAAMEASPSADLALLRANFNFKMHRMAKAKEDLALIGDEGRMLSAQIAMQEGDYATARAEYERVAESKHTWDSLASLAYHHSVTGDAGAADRLYAEAEEEITAKQMRSYAWVEVQRGLLDFDRRRYAEALVHYQRADKAYSGYWLVEEHIAEVLDKLGRTAESVALYQRVIERTHNPEYVGALAAIVARSDPAAAAKLWSEADALYDAQMRLYPEAAGGHLIRELLARADAPLPRLVTLAEQNATLRPNGEAKLLLAKAYWKAQRTEDARRVLAEVLRTPWRTPELETFARASR